MAQKKNWFRRNEYAATWLEILFLIANLIPLSYFTALFIIHSTSGQGVWTVGNASCLVSIKNQTAYDKLINEVCPQMKDITNLPLPQSIFVPSIYIIENTTNVAYVGFHVIKEYGSCYVQPICYSK